MSGLEKVVDPDRSDTSRSPRSASWKYNFDVWYDGRHGHHKMRESLCEVVVKILILNRMLREMIA